MIAAQLDSVQAAKAVLQAQLQQEQQVSAGKSKNVKELEEKLASDRDQWDALAAQQQSVLEATKAERDSAVSEGRERQAKARR